MEYPTNEAFHSNSENCQHNMSGDHRKACPQCCQMMNEIIQLRIALGRTEGVEKRSKKSFTIAPTLYTFFRNGLAKRHLARYNICFCEYDAGLPAFRRPIYLIL